MADDGKHVITSAQFLQDFNLLEVARHNLHLQCSKYSLLGYTQTTCDKLHKTSTLDVFPLKSQESLPNGPERMARDDQTVQRAKPE